MDLVVDAGEPQAAPKALQLFHVDHEAKAPALRYPEVEFIPRIHPPNDVIELSVFCSGNAHK